MPSETESFQSIAAGFRQRAAEHQRRMAEDPEYRAAYEAEEKRREAEEQERRRVQAIEDARRARMYRREKMGCPKRLWDLLESPSTTSAVQAARDFLSSREFILVLAGGPGCGKTVAANVALDEAYAAQEDKGREIIDGERVLLRPVVARRVGLMVKAIDLARASTFDREFWDGLTEPSVLVVDDLGTEPLDDKGWAVANIRALVDQRYDDASKTILTTNLTLEQFKARYCLDGGRLSDRIREAGAFVELADASMRRAAP